VAPPQQGQAAVASEEEGIPDVFCQRWGPVMAAVARRVKEWMPSVFCQQCWVLMAHVADKALESARLCKTGRGFVSRIMFVTFMVSSSGAWCRIFVMGVESKGCSTST